MMLVSWVPLWRPLGGLLGRLGGLFGRLGAILSALERSFGDSGRSWTVLGGPLGALLGSSSSCDSTARSPWGTWEAPGDSGAMGPGLFEDFSG
eukprot:1955351-Pyramimonas_sp.AAC.1